MHTNYYKQNPQRNKKYSVSSKGVSNLGSGDNSNLINDQNLNKMLTSVNKLLKKIQKDS